MVQLSKITDSGTRVHHKHFGNGTVLSAQGRIVTVIWATRYPGDRPLTVMDWEITPVR